MSSSSRSVESIPESTNSYSHSRAFWAAVLVCIVIALLSRFSFLFDPFKNDAGIYIYFGRVLHDGGRLYQDFWDTKLPSIALLTAPLYALFGNHWWGYVLTLAVMGVAAAWILALGVKRYVGVWAYGPALLFGLIGFNFQRIVLTGFQLETVQLFFEVVAGVVILRTLVRPRLMQVFVAGLLVGVAAMPKPNGLSVGLAAICVYLWDLRRESIKAGLRRIALFVLGIAIPIALVALWVAMQPWRGEMPEVLRQIRLYGSGVPLRRFTQWQIWIFFVIPLIPLLIQWAWRAVGERSSERWVPAATVAQQRIVLFAVAWFLAEFAGVVLQRRLYSYHYLVMMPPAVLIYSLTSSRRLTPIVVSILPLALLSVVYSIPGYRMYREGGHMAVSDYIAARTSPADAVWGDPAGRLLLETDRPSGSRLQMTFYMVNYDGAPRHFADILLADFEQRKPKYIMLMQDWAHTMYSVPATSGWMKWVPGRERAYLRECHRIEDYIRANYSLETSLDGRCAYRRRESSNVR